MSELARQAPLTETAFTRRVTDALPDAVMVMAEDGSIVYANAAAAQVNRFEGPEAMIRVGIDGVSAEFELADESGVHLSADRRPFMRAFHGELPANGYLVRRIHKKTGDLQWIRTRPALIADENGRRLVVSLYADVTEEVKTDQIAQFISRATTVLGSSLDYDATLRQLADLAVPTIADWCGVDMVTESGKVRQLAVAHADPKKVALAKRLGELLPYNPDAEHGTPYAIRTGNSELMPEMPEGMVAAAVSDPEVRAMVESLGIRSWMCVPLKVRDRVLGAMSFVGAESGRKFDERALAMAQDLAFHAAIAVDNAQLFREVQRSNARLNAVLTQMASSVVIADRDGVVTFANQAAQEMYGALDEGWGSMVTAEYDVELLSISGEPLTRDQIPLLRALRGEHVIGFEWRLRRANGTELALETAAGPILGQNGEILGAVATSQDVTPRYELDRQRENFFLSASHDLQTPLTVIKGQAQFLHQQLERRGEENLQLLGSLLRIDSTATRMSHLVRELLDMARIQTGSGLSLNLHRLDLVTVMGRVIEDAGTAFEHHEIRLDVKSAPLIGEWDDARLERVLYNVLSNAVKFSPPNHDGEKMPIEVRLSHTEAEGQPCALVSVTDHGIGIPAAELPYIFDRFHRADNVGRVSGSGIGLAASRQIIQLMGGTIFGESVEGDGATFTVSLPLTEASRSTL
jgi:PAS domain S-box-containing protein